MIRLLCLLAAALVVVIGTAVANPMIEGVEGVLLSLAGNLLGAQLFVPSNDVLDAGSTNFWVGFQSQVECSSDNGFSSTVEGGGGLPCVPNSMYPPFGSGLQRLPNFSADDCAFKAAIGAASVQQTVVPSLQVGGTLTGVTFGNPPPGFVAGGVCSPRGAQQYSFVGDLLGMFTIIAVGVLSDVQCAYLVNMCTAGCSCGPYSR